ncbi:MAG TPA: 4-(cytidine 5'-diphospho)-2-C-methyl-D-erythritol kinase [Casimicrobiaceae bacterium]
MSGAPAALTVAAPAKINLFLHVVGRRPDGYHFLESLFVLIDWCDTITLTRRADAHIVRGDVAGIPEATDLAVRAAQALRDATGTHHGVTIEMIKRIPQGAGLGGGSSDAACVLLALNRLWSLHLPRSELAAIGAQLGADVPFFIGGESALARGIGDLLTPVSIPMYWLALATPPIRVATPSIFAELQLTPLSTSAKMNVFSEGYGRNDLEATATARFAAIGRAREALSHASPNARMTGSGGCVFAAFSTEREAKQALRHLPQEIEGRVVRTLARHPLSAFA